MKLEFKVLKLKEESETFKKLKSLYERLSNPRHEFINEFIVVGDEGENSKVLQLHEEGISLVGDFKLDHVAYTMPKEDFVWDGTLYTELDISKDRLTTDIVDNIQRLNS